MNHTLQSLLNQLEDVIDQNEKLNTQISSASVGWHIEHSLIVVEKMIHGLELSNPNEYNRKFNVALTKTNFTTV